jgi:hypothetical protein
VPRVLLATDADWIHQEVDAALGGDDIDVVRVHQGVEVRPAVQASKRSSAAAPVSQRTSIESTKLACTVSGRWARTSA